ncbi:MAG: hypothetical protein MUE72_02760 [Chitinophagaceae bacterium]|nr:hypothetical protein [Chitinophagaceae bacterium]
MKNRLLKLLFIVVSGFTSTTTIAQGNLEIEFKHIVGKQPLVLFDSLYTNNFNEPFVVNKLKYYISNITVYNNQIKTVKNGYYLIDASNSSTHLINIIASTKNIDAIEFTIGVDSLKNTEGVQTGALDPMNGMFWTWNSGYIFAKLEGQSDSSKAASNYFTYHIGGYKNNENALQTIYLKINQPILNTRKIMIDVDVLKWFNGASSLRIAETQICHQPGQLAQQIAKNYASMFSIATVEE